jgi:vacuolar-type H+-ATPase subunit I/STV1
MNFDPPVGALDLLPISTFDFKPPNFASMALRRLQEIYSSRPDLQSAYPEARRGDYARLFDWASKVVSGVTSDSSRDLIASFDLFGMQRILDEMNVQLQNQARAFSDERAALTTKLQELETERAHLSEKLDRLCSDFSLNESRLRRLEAEATKLEMRLAAAKVAYENELTETKISKHAEGTRLQAQLVSKDAEVARLQAQLVSKDAEVARLQAQLVSKNTEGAELKGQLDLIAASTTWKLIGVARRFEEKHLPPGSDRGRQFKHLINSVNRVVSRMLR